MSQTDMQVKEVSSSVGLELKARIEAFELDSPESKLPFSRRLARDNAWNHEYARRVIAEYKRFAFLAMAAGHPVTPSDPVDQAWHLHMIYTESYWKEFCGEVLGKPLHHGPTRGGAQEGVKHFDWYTRTLESYEKWFREPAPSDIWPAPAERFTDAAHFIRINTRHAWVIPKPVFWRISERTWRNRSPEQTRSGSMRLAGAVCLTIGIVGCVGTINVFDYRGPDFLSFYLWFALILFAVARFWQWSHRVPARAAEETDIPTDPYEIAYLAGGPRRVLESALAELLQQRVLEIDQQGKIRALRRPEAVPNLHPLEKTLLLSLSRTSAETFSSVQQRLSAISDPILTALAERGLTLTREAGIKLRSQTLRWAGLVPMLGFIKIMLGIDRDKPVGYLIVLTILTTILTFVFFGRRPARTRLGDNVVRLLRERHSDMRREFSPHDSQPAHAGALATGVGLFGLGMLTHTSLAADYRRLHTNYQGSSGDSGTSGCSTSSGCGSSDSSSDSGGSGCGGGCGGCGGGGGD